MREEAAPREKRNKIDTTGLPSDLIMKYSGWHVLTVRSGLVSGSRLWNRHISTPAVSCSSKFPKKRKMQTKISGLFPMLMLFDEKVDEGEEFVCILIYRISDRFTVSLSSSWCIFLVERLDHSASIAPLAKDKSPPLRF